MTEDDAAGGGGGEVRGTCMQLCVHENIGEL